MAGYTTTDELTAEQRDILSHALGGAYPWKIKRGHGFRNYYCAEVGGKDHRDCDALVAKGFMRAGGRINNGGDQYFYVTEAGAAAVGLKLPKPE